MSLLTKGGITRLSELTIDADKNWQAMGISNLKELVLGMAKGDLVVRSNAVLERLPPSTIGYVLTSAGPNHMPSWQPAPGPLLYYFPAAIDLSHAEAKVTVDRNIPKTGPITSEYKQAYVDAPADLIKLLTPTLTITENLVKPTVDKTWGKTIIPGRDISILIDGAVSETNAGVQTDETAAARSGAVGDMNLNPMTPIVGDKYYFGFSRVFPRMWLNLSAPGVGNWINTLEYWNGAWVACVDEVDESSEFQAAAGWKRIQWTPQVDWALTPIMGMNLYWIRSITTNFIGQTVKPLGAQVFCCLVT